MTLGWWKYWSDYMARPLKPFIRGGGYYPSKRWTPLVYPGGYTTANGGGQPEPEAVLKTVTGSLIHITDALALPAEALTVNVEPVQAGSGDPSPENVRPISGRTSATVTRTGKNLVNTSDITDYSKWSADIATSGDMASNASNRIYSLPKFAAGLQYTISFGITPESFPPYLYFGYYKDDVTKRIAYITTATIGNQNISFTALEGVTYCLRMGNSQAQGAFNSQIAKLSYIQLELGSTASAYEPYQGNTYTITLGDTVYGGTLDVTQGKMVVTHVSADMGELSYVRPSSADVYVFRNNIGAAPVTDNIQHGLTSIYPFAGTRFTAAMPDKSWMIDSAGRFTVRDDSYTDVNAFKTAMTGQTLVYELATPIEITLTPTQIDMLQGENNLWSDAGDSTLTYYAEGEASTSEALGILLGGTYNNPGGADDVSDDEALGILLGGS